VVRKSYTKSGTAHAIRLVLKDMERAERERPPSPWAADWEDPIEGFGAQARARQEEEARAKAAMAALRGEATPALPVEEKAPAKQREWKGRALGPVWRNVIVPQITLKLKDLPDNKYATLDDAVDAVVALAGFPWKKLTTRKAIRNGIRTHFREWFKVE
jgi:hypothetical protein